MRRVFGGLIVGVVAAFALAGCGPDYDYVESSDGHLFGKVPSDWEIFRQGAVDFELVSREQVQFAFTTGDSTEPWRAEFRAGSGSDAPSGSFEAQHVDARFRREFLLSQYIRWVKYLGVEDIELRPVTVAGLDGYRVTARREGDGATVQDEAVFLIDDRRSAVYRATVGCSEACHERYRDEIDEVLTTFRVEI